MADSASEKKAGELKAPAGGGAAAADAALASRLSELLRAKPAQTARQLTGQAGGATKQQVQRVLYHSGLFEKSEGQPRWSLRPGCLPGCSTRGRFRVGSTCVHLGADPTNDELRALVQAIRAFDSGDLVAGEQELSERLRRLA